MTKHQLIAICLGIAYATLAWVPCDWWPWVGVVVLGWLGYNAQWWLPMGERVNTTAEAGKE